jgi:hypothetical protein
MKKETFHIPSVLGEVGDLAGVLEKLYSGFLSARSTGDEEASKRVTQSNRRVTHQIFNDPLHKVLEAFLSDRPFFSRN